MTIKQKKKPAQTRPRGLSGETLGLTRIDRAGRYMFLMHGVALGDEEARVVSHRAELVPASLEKYSSAADAWRWADDTTAAPGPGEAAAAGLISPVPLSASLLGRECCPGRRGNATTGCAPTAFD